MDIVSVIGAVVSLKRSGDGYIGKCPFHADNKPSLRVYPSTQSFYCFGCGAGSRKSGIIGNCEGFVKAYYVNDRMIEDCNLVKPKVIEKKMERRLTDMSLEIYKETAEFYHSELLRSTDCLAYQYLEQKRGYSLELIKHFKLGEAKGGCLHRNLRELGYTNSELLESGVVCNRGGQIKDYFYFGLIIYPHYIDDRVVGFTVKDPNEERDIRYSLVRKDHFYNQDVIKSVESVIIVEGENDLFCHFMEGRRNVVALCGTYFGDKHLEILKASGVGRVELDFDDDEAGRNANDMLLETLLTNKLG